MAYYADMSPCDYFNGLPPKEFREAVIECPEMGSAAYLKSIRQIDPELARFMFCPGQGDRQERTALIKSAKLWVW